MFSIILYFTRTDEGPDTVTGAERRTANPATQQALPALMTAPFPMEVSEDGFESQWDPGSST